MNTALPLLDSDAALARIRGKTELYRRLLEQAEPHRDGAARIEAAWAQADWPGVAQISHRIAGVAATLGAERLAAIALSLEREAEAEAPEQAVLLQFLKTLADTFAAIDAYLGKVPENCAAQAESWCQVRQTVLMLELAAAQIHVAMRDSSVSVEALMGAFTTMVERFQGLEARIRAEDPEGNEGVSQVSSAMDEALMALQFYDRLAQRLEHVEHGLGHLAELLGNPERIASPPAWTSLQDEIRSRYTTEEERIMFASVMSGVPVAEAITHYKETVLARTGTGNAEVELF